MLLAMNETGYKNLLKLASAAQLEGFYYKPRIDKEILVRWNEGLIAMTACLHGEIPHDILRGDMRAAKIHIQEFQTLFGDRFYLEIQENGIPEQRIVNDGLKALARELKIPLVATNDCHYLTREEAHSHEVLLCVQTGKTIQDQNRFKFSTDQLYFKSPEEMKALFAETPEALATSLAIADRCNLALRFGEYHFPLFPVREGETLGGLLPGPPGRGNPVCTGKVRRNRTCGPDRHLWKDLIAYQTAYLKTHYPAQFIVALLSCDVGNTDKVVRYINECKTHQIEVLPPDINESDHDFTVVADRIRFGLAAVKNVGGSALDSIMEVRGKDGPFCSLTDFCSRVDLRRVNHRVIESLIKAGAFDSFGKRRSQLFAVLDQALDQAQGIQKEKMSGQMSLFSYDRKRRLDLVTC